MHINQAESDNIVELSGVKHFRYEIDVKTKRTIDYDVSCFCIDASNRLVDTKDFIFYNQKHTPCRSIELIRDEEEIPYFKIKPQALPSYVSKLVFILTCDNPADIMQLDSVALTAADNTHSIEVGDLSPSNAIQIQGSIVLSVLHVGSGLESKVLGLHCNNDMAGLLDAFTNASFGYDELLAPNIAQVRKGSKTEESNSACLTQKTADISEQDMYPKLIEYINSSLEIHGMRIDEKTSSNKRGRGGNHWLHPDVVALETIDEEWDILIRNCVRLSGGQSAKLWSFEVKKELNGSNARMAFFQAVSNSSWANQGYLVACSIHHSVEVELKMLSALHGIGVILLDPQNPDNSTIWLQAVNRERVDWQTANRIASTNRDFKRYIDQVSTYYETGRLRKSDWGD